MIINRKNFYKALSQYIYLLSTLLIQLAVVFLLPKIMATENYAEVVYAQSFAIWGGLLIEYGFSFSATRNIVLHPERINNIVNSVRVVNYILAIFFFFTAPLIAFNLPLFANNPNLILLSVLLAIVQGVTPWWYFQAKQSLYKLAFLDFFASLLIVFSWFLLKNSENIVVNILLSHLIVKFLIMSVGQLMVWLDVKYTYIGLKDIFSELKNGFSLFFFMFSTAIYTTLNVLVLGLYASYREIAMFAVSEKIMRLAVRSWEPLNRFLYTKSIKLSLDKEVFIIFIKKIFWAYLFLGLVISTVLIFTNEFFILYFLGEEFYESIPIFCILIISIPMIAISNVIGVLYLLPTGKDRVFNAVIVGGGVFHLFFSFIMVYKYGVLGMAISVVVTESIVAALMLFIVYYYRKIELIQR